MLILLNLLVLFLFDIYFYLRLKNLESGVQKIYFDTPVPHLVSNLFFQSYIQTQTLKLMQQYIE